MGGKQGEHAGTLSGRNGKGEGLVGRKGRGGGTGKEDRKGSWEELGEMGGELGGDGKKGSGVGRGLEERKGS